MKLLVCSDLHADHVTAGFRRACDVEAAVQMTVDAAIELKVAAWMCLGDVSDPDSGAATIRAIELTLRTAEQLDNRGILNVWIPGNHDVVEDGSGRTVLSPLKAAKFRMTRVFDDPFVNYPLAGTSRGRGVVLHPLPFVPRSHAYDPEKVVLGASDHPELDDLTHVFAGHLQLEGAKLGSETYDVPRGRDVAFPSEAVKRFRHRVCLNGHYHRRQMVGEVQVVGSLERLTFAEEGNQPGFLVVDL